MDPCKEFGALFRKLVLPFTRRIERYVRAFSSPENPADPPDGTTILKMNSRRNDQSWKNRLTTEEQQRIRRGTCHISSHFYAPSDL